MSTNKITIKTEQDIKNLRESGHILAEALRLAVSYVRPNVTTNALDDVAHDYIISHAGAVPAFLGYQPYGADFPFPATLCISVNDAIVHGIPDEYMLQVGDIVSLDGGVKYKGMISDAAVSVIVTDTGCTTIIDILNKIKIGEENNKKTEDVLDKKEKLLYITYKSMMEGIKAACVGRHVESISRAIAKEIPKEYGVVKIFTGHGVGYHVHEEPYVPNYIDGVKGPIMKSGLVLAIEPMITLGTDEVDFLDDGYTAVTSDGSLAAHFEHTIVVTEQGGEILTM